MHTWFWDLVVLLLLRRPGLEVKSCCLVSHGDCGPFCAFRVLKSYVLAAFSPVIARWLKSNRSLLLFRPMLACSCLCPYLWRESSRLSCRLSEGMHMFRVSRVSFLYLPLVLSRESFWLLLSKNCFYLTLRYENYRDSLFRICCMLSMSLLSDRTNSSKMAVLSVRN